jgi:hypothetical protein
LFIIIPSFQYLDYVRITEDSEKRVAGNPTFLLSGTAYSPGFTSNFGFGLRKLGWGGGTAARFAEAPAGNPVFIDEPKGLPKTEAEGLRPRPDL